MWTYSRRNQSNSIERRFSIESIDINRMPIVRLIFDCIQQSKGNRIFTFFKSSITFDWLRLFMIEFDWLRSKPIEDPTAIEPIEFLHFIFLRLSLDWIRQSNSNRSIGLRLNSIDSAIEKFDWLRLAYFIALKFCSIKISVSWSKAKNSKTKMPRKKHFWHDRKIQMPQKGKIDNFGKNILPIAQCFVFN